MFNTLIPSAQVKFRDTVDVATIINNSHHIDRNGSDKNKIQYKKRTAKPVRSIYAHLQWNTIPKNKRRTDKETTKSNKQAQVYNMYNNLENDELQGYGEYKSTYILDTAASGNYGDIKTKVKKKRKEKSTMESVLDVPIQHPCNKWQKEKYHLKNFHQHQETSNCFRICMPLY